jgi:hypothetical protein
MELVSKCFMLGIIKCCTSCMRVMDNVQLIIVDIARKAHKRGKK